MLEAKNGGTQYARPKKGGTQYAMGRGVSLSLTEVILEFHSIYVLIINISLNKYFQVVVFSEFYLLILNTHFTVA